MGGYTGKWNLQILTHASGGESDLKLLSEKHSIIIKCLVKITHPEHKNRITVRVFDLEILAANRSQLPNPSQLITTDRLHRPFYYQFHVLRTLSRVTDNDIRRHVGNLISSLRSPETLFCKIPSLGGELYFHVFNHTRVAAGVDLSIILGKIKL